MAKIINSNETVYEICSKYPEALEIMKKAGFDNIAEPGMLNTVGRFMTISKGAKMKNLDLEVIRQAFIENGFNIVD